MSGEQPGPPPWGAPPGPGTPVPPGYQPTWPTSAPPGHAPPVRVRPAGGWFALPISLIVLAVLAVVLVGVTQADGLRAADDGDVVSSGDSVSVSLVEGATYHVYVPDGSQAVPQQCLLGSDEGTGSIPFGADGPLWQDDPFVADDGSAWTLVGSFESPVEGDALVGCLASPTTGVYVQPDERPFVFLGFAVMGAGLVGLVAVILIVVFAVMRSRSRRRQQLVGPYGGVWTGGPYPGAWGDHPGQGGASPRDRHPHTGDVGGSSGGADTGGGSSSHGGYSGGGGFDGGGSGGDGG